MNFFHMLQLVVSVIYVKQSVVVDYCDGMMFFKRGERIGYLSYICFDVCLWYICTG